MIKVNLVPAEILAKARQKQRVLQAAAGGVVLVIVLLLASLGHYVTLKHAESKLAADQAKLKKLQVIVNQVEEIQKTTAALHARLGVVADLLKGRTLYPRFMSDFARSVPPGVQVKSLATSGGGSSVGPVKLSMSAQAHGQDDIASWLRRLETFGTGKSAAALELGRFSDINLGPIAAAGTSKGYNFSVTAVYNR
ncbi:MAG: PilN domain-containing protein [Elusimicrobia bacterium]|nr:PilN domain-containing protein [Elusimicrobiota bacterium]MDE2424353.1 PilN domain-containing protein [Elusimicrobiota bacterium]